MEESIRALITEQVLEAFAKYSDDLAELKKTISSQNQEIQELRKTVQDLTKRNSVSRSQIFQPEKPWDSEFAKSKCKIQQQERKNRNLRVNWTSPYPINSNKPIKKQKLNMWPKIVPNGITMFFLYLVAKDSFPFRINRSIPKQCKGSL